MKKAKRILSIILVLVMCLGIVPVAAAAEPGKTKTGISSVYNEDLRTLGLDTTTTALLKQAQDTDNSPYGNGKTSVIPIHELALFGDIYYPGGGYASVIYDDVIKSKKNAGPHYGPANYHFMADSPSSAVAVRSVAFDALGHGKDDCTAIVYALVKDKQTKIMLEVASPQNGDWETADFKLKGFRFIIELSTLPFELEPENAGAYLSIAAGNYDGDDLNTDEIAVYRPFYGLDKNGKNMYSGQIDILKPVELPKKGGFLSASYELCVEGSYNLYNQSKFYFYDNSAIGDAIFNQPNDTKYPKKDYWKYMYRIPAVSLETVTQEASDADDLCVTYSPAMWGGRTKELDIGPDGTEYKINAVSLYDSATAVFFWIDPLTSSQKKTWSDQMRWGWQEDYKASRDLNEGAYDQAKKHSGVDELYEVMTFGGAGAGDINGDGVNEVVIGGYLFANRQFARVPNYISSLYVDGDNVWSFSKNEYLTTYYTYDAAENTYRIVEQSGNWVSTRSSDYKKGTNIMDGVYTNYGSKDIIHGALDVTCFAERGTGYADSIAIGGIVCRFDNSTGTSACTPFKDKGLANYNFEYGTIDGIYAIPAEAIHKNTLSNASIQNRVFTESVAGNFDGNLLGQEQLAFAYIAKKKESSKYYTAYGLIYQKTVGDDVSKVKNTDKKENNYLDTGVAYYCWKGDENDNKAPISLSAVDIDNDSYIMRRSARPNDYFFSDPEIIAVLQAAPFFKDVKYGSTDGTTSFETIKGSTTETAHGVSSSLSVQVGAVAEVALGVVIGGSTYGGVSSEFSRTYGEGHTTSYSLNFTASTDNSVALVMTPVVRYYYEMYIPTEDKWEEVEVDLSHTPRASMVTTDKYDAVAALYGWEKIEGNILKNEEGVPETYPSTSKGMKDFYGGHAQGYGIKQDENYGSDNFVRLGNSGDSTITQKISTEKNDTTSTDWSVLAAYDDEMIFGSVGLKISATLGYTGSKSKTTFAGFEYSGSVVNLPKNGYDDYSFSWQFGHWTDSLNVTSTIGGKQVAQVQTFPVLGYLVTDVYQPIPPIRDTMLHISKNGANTLGLAWKANSGAVGNFYNDGYTLFRKQDGVYYPMASMDLSEAVDGWFNFIDVYAAPARKYEYALRPYAYTGDGTLYGDYISPIEGYTISDSEYAPEAEIVSEKSGNMQKLSVSINAVTEGDVGAVITQWQEYLPDKGGWIDVASGYNTLSITVGANEDMNRYRCRVTQRVEKEIYTTYSQVNIFGYVFVAGKSNPYTNKLGKSVVDYTIVYEDGKVDVIASENSTYTKYDVYAFGYDEYGSVFLEEDKYTRAQQSVSKIVNTDTIEINGGKSSYDGQVLSGVESAKALDVSKLVKAIGSAPLLNGGKTAEQVVAGLPKVSTAAISTNDAVSYAYNPVAKPETDAEIKIEDYNNLFKNPMAGMSSAFWTSSTSAASNNSYKINSSNAIIPVKSNSTNDLIAAVDKELAVTIKNNVSELFTVASPYAAIDDSMFTVAVANDVYGELRAAFIYGDKVWTEQSMFSNTYIDRVPGIVLPSVPINPSQPSRPSQSDWESLNDSQLSDLYDAISSETMQLEGALSNYQEGTPEYDVAYEKYLAASDYYIDLRTFIETNRPEWPYWPEY